jgi:ribosomal protein S18 acetylase RimI-like enzyme
MDTTIRRMMKEDVVLVYELMKNVFKDSPLMALDSVSDFHEYEGFVVESRTTTSNNSNTNNNTVNVNVLQKTYNKEIIGALLYSIHYSYSVPQKFCYLEYIGTNITNSGIGTCLLKEFLRFVDKHNFIAYLHVEKTKDLERLLKWYVSVGFEIKQIENVYPYFLQEEKMNAIMMVRNN